MIELEHVCRDICTTAFICKSESVLQTCCPTGGDFDMRQIAGGPRGPPPPSGNDQDMRLPPPGMSGPPPPHDGYPPHHDFDNRYVNQVREMIVKLMKERVRELKVAVNI